MAVAQAFHGTIIHSLGLDRLEIIEDGLITIDADGVILQLEKSIAWDQVSQHVSSLSTTTTTTTTTIRRVRRLPRGQFLVPGFVDTHHHAPQWAQRGLGQGLPILDWLDRGATTAAYYGSRHGAATRILADLCAARARGQRALSLADTEACIAHIRALEEDPAAAAAAGKGGGALVRPVLTPRFALACDAALLAGLGALARARAPGPRARRLDLYAHFGLLGPRTVLAHCCHMSEHELGRVAAAGAGVAHCPVANLTVGGGFMAAPVRACLRRGIPVGLGSDSGGGFASGILDAMRMALVAANAREAQTAGADAALSIPEVFHLATLGGARVCGLDARVGNFLPGKEFDALLVCAEADGVMTMLEEWDSAMTVFEKFVMTADDRNIQEVYVRGRSVKTQGTPSST
ncbi:hypothetical protein F4780DRAFT_795388 [Xylariomycetidae sp. FL0641]|nr:hypothetical protein F4780DRAFT_795388 [Xylariomycetidae sp. FL0641]